MVANLSAATIERALLTDPSRCPSCGTALHGPRCGACGVDLSGPLGHRLWDVSTRAAGPLDQREHVLGDLRRAVRPVAAPVGAVPVAPPMPQPAQPAGPAAPVSTNPQVSQAPAQPATPPTQPPYQPPRPAQAQPARSGG